MKFLLTTDTHYGGEYTRDILNRFWHTVKRESPDVILHTGDWAGSTYKSVGKSFKQLREIIPTTPVLTVLGNHDIWSYPHQKPYAFVMDNLMKMFKEYNIHYLTNGGYQIADDIFVAGFDGWYFHNNVGTRDISVIDTTINNIPTFTYLQNKAYTDMARILDMENDDDKLICLTHFQPYSALGYDINTNDYWGGNPKYLKFLTDRCDYLCCGHDHFQYDKTVDGCRILNAGSDYDNPKYLTFDL